MGNLKRESGDPGYRPIGSNRFGSVSSATGGCDIGIVVSDGARALAFYEGALGCQREHDLELSDGGTLYRLRWGNSVLKVMAPGTRPRRPAPRDLQLPLSSLEDLVRECVRNVGYCYVALTVSGLAAIYESALALGCRVVYELTNTRPGTWIAVVEDPDGNWVELVEYTQPELASADLETKDLRRSR